MRRFCGLDSATSFDGLSDHITGPSVRATLSSNYASPDDTDLCVGGMVEDPVVSEGRNGTAAIGQVFNGLAKTISGGLVGWPDDCLHNWRPIQTGFYFENPGIFTDAQTTELKKTSFSRILRDNSDRVTEVPSQAFLLPFSADTSSCASVVHFDLYKWREQ
ncbi:hypothetical protein niasHT_038884 [Heterodera trifolii]|uniref:Uncharacterized protein n=1 Tax=Heterodera trifolii TaxID=157864 RepID=A0ABD2IQR3_9BILA